MTRPDLKSLAHKDWPYAGSAHEWRGFVKGRGFFSKLTKEQQEAALAYRAEENHGDPIYQKQNFGPKLD